MSPVTRNTRRTDPERDAIEESKARHPSACVIPVPLATVTVIRDPQGGRNFVRKGDTVHVDPSAPGRRDGFDARFIEAHVDGDGVVVDIEVYGGRDGRASVRTFRPGRVRRTRRPVR